MQWRLSASGSCRHLEVAAFKGGRWRQAVFPALWAALELEPGGGWLVVDTGYAPRVTRELCRSGWWRLYPLLLPVSIREEETAARRMAGKQVTGIFLTHFHVDHEAGLRDFPGVPVYTSREGWEFARTRRGLRGLLAAHAAELLPEDFTDRVRLLDLNRSEPCVPEWVPAGWEAGADVLGDGRLWAVPLPGHAAGQSGLMFRDGEGRVIFLVADALWRVDWLRRDRGPRAAVRLVCHDWAAFGDTLERLRALAQARPDILMVPFHCGATSAQFVSRS